MRYIIKLHKGHDSLELRFVRPHHGPTSTRKDVVEEGGGEGLRLKVNVQTCYEVTYYDVTYYYDIKYKNINVGFHRQDAELSSTFSDHLSITIISATVHITATVCFSILYVIGVSSKGSFWDWGVSTYCKWIIMRLGCPPQDHDEIGMSSTGSWWDWGVLPQEIGVSSTASRWD